MKTSSLYGLPQPDANVTAFLVLDSKEYELSYFKVGFIQPTDHKGEPQHEVLGGQLCVTLTQLIEEDIFKWAVQSEERKSGVVEFRLPTSSSPMRVEFNNAYCVNFNQKMSPMDKTGVETTLVLSAEEVIMNGIDLNKFWA